MAMHSMDRFRSHAEDECIRDLRNALVARLNLSSLKRRCATPPELRPLCALLSPLAGRASELLQPGAFRRNFVQRSVPWWAMDPYAECQLTYVMESSLLATEFESWYSIADGLYLGDRDAGHDFAFLRKFKITKIVNCCGHALENDWENHGIDYLTYDWVDLASQAILDEEDLVIDEIFAFVEEAVQKGQGVMVQSFNGHSRSVCVMAAFLMRRHGWSLHETLEYIHFRCPSINPNVGFLRQLQEYEQRLQDTKEYRFALTARAREATGAPNVELQLRDGETMQNTLSNTIQTVFAPRPPRVVGRKLKIQFADSDPQVALYHVGSCLDVDEARTAAREEGQAVASKPLPASRAASPSKPLLKRPTYANRSPDSKVRPQSDKVGLDRWGRSYKRRASKLFTASKCLDFDVDVFQNLDRNAGQALNSFGAVAA